MRQLFIIPLRNLRRRALRTSLTLGMTGLGTALIVFTLGLTEGTYSDMIRMATRSWAGHFQVTAEGFTKKPSLFKTIADANRSIAAIKSHPEVRGVTPRVETAGLLAAGNRTSGTLLFGVDPAGERKVTTVANTVSQGAWLDAPSAETLLPLVIGSGMAKRLRVQVGDEVSFIGQAADGSIAAENFTITGVVASGSEELDAAAVWIRITDAQELLSLGQRAHRLVGIVDDMDRLEAIGATLRLEPGQVFLPWKEVMPSLHQTIEGDRAVNWIFLGILLMVVALGIANTMTMVVMERTREFGVMMALGTSPLRVLILVLIEAFWVCGLGATLGLALGMGVNYITTFWGIPVASEPISYGGVIIEVMHAENNLFGSVLAPSMVLVCGLLAALFPAIRAARLRPAEALREG